jgi:hypothetical protein
MVGRISRAADTRRRAYNTPGFVPPPMEPVATPDPVARTEPNPRLIEPPPAGTYALRPVEGPFALVGADSTAIRRVTEADLGELLEWALPIYQKRHPRATIESMLPLLRQACHDNHYRFLRTPDATGLFVFQTTPWEPAGEVIDLFVVARDGAVTEAVKIYRAGLNWAKEMRAAEFWFAEDTGNELEPIALRIGCDLRSHRFGKRML